MDGHDETLLFRELDARFALAVARVLEGSADPTLLYSGGVDSTLVALAARRVREIEALVIGIPGSPDLKRARTAADRIGIALREVTVADEAVRRLLDKERESLSHLGEPRRGVQVAMTLAVSASASPRVIAGQGADELFGGYAHFRGLEGADLERKRVDDLARFLERDWPLSRALAQRRGHDLRSPFIDPGFLELALSIPLEPVGLTGLTKPVLRRWAVHRGMPEEIALRPKRAMQYGSGIASTLRRAGSATPPIAPVGRI